MVEVLEIFLLQKLQKPFPKKKTVTLLLKLKSAETICLIIMSSK